MVPAVRPTKPGVALRTIKTHRARVMQKMGVISVAELVRLAQKAGVAPRLAALPVDFAFLDVFVFEVVEQAAREQRDEDGREAVRLLVLKGVVSPNPRYSVNGITAVWAYNPYQVRAPKSRGSEYRRLR